MIVQTDSYPYGKVHICDDSCKDLSREELEARVHRMQVVVNRILQDAGQRAQAEAASVKQTG